MGLEKLRRWPMYIAFSVCIMLMLSLFNSWSLENELRAKFLDMSVQLQECSKLQAMCMEESSVVSEQRDRYLDKVNELDKKRTKLNNDIVEYKTKVAATETQVNRTLVDLVLCKTELESLKNLQESKSVTLETLRLEKNTLTTQLVEKNNRITELEAEIEKLKATLTSKSAPNLPASMKVTPAAQPPRMSSALNAHNPINEPVIENNAKEDIEDPNALNDSNNFDP